jgi:hypothetical protein
MQLRAELLEVLRNGALSPIRNRADHGTASLGSPILLAIKYQPAVVVHLMASSQRPNVHWRKGRVPGHCDDAREPHVPVPPEAAKQVCFRWRRRCCRGRDVSGWDLGCLCVLSLVALLLFWRASWRL